MSTSDSSPDVSGYITSRTRRTNPTQEERDPSEQESEEDTADSSVRVPVPVPTPTGEGPSRRPRTARMRVLPPRNVTFSVPSRHTGEPSHSRSAAPSSPAIGVPVPRTRGMTETELEWTTRLAREVEIHRHSLNYFRNSMSSVLEIMQSQDLISNRTLEIATDARAEAQLVHAYLLWLVGMLAFISGVLLVVWRMY